MWLLREETLRELSAARALLAPPTADQQSEHVQELSAARDEGPQSLTVAGDVAELAVEGVLVQRQSFWLWLLGYAQTSYADLQAAIAEVRGNLEVKSVRVMVNSPGGQVDGLFDTLAAFESLRAEKSVSVLAKSAYSAAYSIAAVAGPIQAQGRSSGFGSVGVATSIDLDEGVVDLTNTESPDKRPDVTTEEGRAVVVKHLDDIFGLYVEGIAAGRGTKVSDVTANYGRGASLLADEAMSRGMIDSIAQTQLRVVRSASAQAVAETPRADAGGAQQEREHMAEQEMDLRTLRAQNPELCEELIAIGVAQERDRVDAHLILGEQAGALPVAFAAIRDGSGMTATVNARYVAAGMNRASQTARQAESDAAGAVVDGAKPEAEPVTAKDALMETVVSALEARVGKGTV